MKSIFGVLILFTSINLIKAQGNCQAPPFAASLLNVEDLIGKWFIVKSYGENYGKCVTVNFETKNETTASEVALSVWEMKPPALDYVIRNQSHVTVTIDETSLLTLNIIDTDYKNFVLIHFCNGNVSNFEERIWILSKNRSLSETLNNSILKKTKFAFPSINFTSNYQLESICDFNSDSRTCPSRQIKQNFNHTQFTGKWYAVKKQERQLDVCITLNINSTLNSTHIFDVQLNQMGGKASSDSGIFNVYYDDVEPIFMQFKILETDYTNYSIVYTCDPSNIEYAWVFSRYESLPSTAETIVNNLTETHFNATKFVNACANETVINTVVCPERRIVQNFSINELAGEWFYVQQYGEYKFDCIKCSFEITDNKTNAFVVRTYGYQANSSDLSVRGQPYAIDSAQLIIHHSVMGRNWTTPFNVLETDYTDYVIINNCFQSSNKSYNESFLILSRNQILSQKAQNAIKSSPHLSNLKLEQLKHSNDYCSVTNTIKPPSQQECPTKIIKTNLNISQVIGVWYLIKQSEQEFDECISIKYEYADNTEMRLKISLADADKPTKFYPIGYGDLKNKTIGAFDMVLNDDKKYKNLQLPFKIFETDYLNYLVGYSCVEYNKYLIPKVFEPVWIFSRTKSLSKSSKHLVDEITSKNFNQTHFNKEECNSSSMFLPGILLMSLLLFINFII